MCYWPFVFVFSLSLFLSYAAYIKNKARQGKTRPDQTRQNKPSQAKPSQAKTRQDKTRQDKTRQDKTRQGKTRQDKPSSMEALENVVPKSTPTKWRTASAFWTSCTFDLILLGNDKNLSSSPVEPFVLENERRQALLDTNMPLCLCSICGSPFPYENHLQSA